MNVEPSLSPWWDLTTAGPGAGDVSPWWGASSPGDPSTAGPGSGGASGRSEADIATLINVIIRPLLIGFGTVGQCVTGVLLLSVTVRVLFTKRTSSKHKHMLHHKKSYRNPKPVCALYL